MIHKRRLKAIQRERARRPWPWAEITPIGGRVSKGTFCRRYTYQFLAGGREYHYHATKGWRSRAMGGEVYADPGDDDNG